MDGRRPVPGHGGLRRQRLEPPGGHPGAGAIPVPPKDPPPHIESFHMFSEPCYSQPSTFWLAVFCHCVCDPSLAPSGSRLGVRPSQERAHRIGQTKEVTVYRLICKETVEPIPSRPTALGSPRPPPLVLASRQSSSVPTLSSGSLKNRNPLYSDILNPLCSISCVYLSAGFWFTVLPALPRSRTPGGGDGPGHHPEAGPHEAAADGRRPGRGPDPPGSGAHEPCRHD